MQTSLSGNEYHEGVEEENSVEESRSQNGRFETLAGVAGNVLEYYDFAIYGNFADILADVFFPKQDGARQLIESFAVFGGAFLMRPLGGIFFGMVGDKYGRKTALELSIFFMAMPTFAMGCLPTYDQVGTLASVLLIIVRLLQGFSVGGQLMTSLAFTLEKKPRAEWGFYGSLVLVATNAGSVLGSVIGASLRSILTNEQLYRWGWRLPFLSGCLVAFCGRYLRKHCKEQMHHEPPNNPLVHAFARRNLRSLLAGSLVPMLGGAGIYLAFMWLPIFMEEFVDPPVPHAFWIATFSLVISTWLFYPIWGWTSDFTGRFKIMVFGIIVFGIIAPLGMHLISLGNPVIAFFSQAVMGIVLASYSGPKMAWLMETFPPEVRLTSMSIGYNIAQAVMGSVSPWAATVLVAKDGPIAAGLYLTFVSFLTLIGMFIAPRTSEHEDVVHNDDEQNVALSTEIA